MDIFTNSKLGVGWTFPEGDAEFFTKRAPASCGVDSDLDNIIEEVDEDGSGTLDFDEFMEMMAG
jgi:hypothetical protein